MLRTALFLAVVAVSATAYADKLETDADLLSVDVNRGYAFAVGTGGEIWSMKLKTGLWSTYRPITKTVLSDVAVVSRKDVWVVGVGGLFIHYDGQEWVSPPGLSDRSFNGVAFADRRRGIAVGDAGRVVQFVRTSWQRFDAMTRSPTLRSIARVGRGRRERFVAVGAKGEAMAFGGVGASLSADVEVTGTKKDLARIAACAGSRAEAVAVGAGAALRDKTSAWGALPEPPSALTGVALQCKRGAVEKVFASTEGGIAVYDVATRKWSTRSIEGAGALNDIAWAGKKELLVVGAGGFWARVERDEPPVEKPGEKQ